LKQSVTRVPQQCLLCGTIFWREPEWWPIRNRELSGFCFGRRWPFKKMATIRQLCGYRKKQPWLYLTTGGILANYIKIGITSRWPGARAMDSTELWPVDLWGCRIENAREIERYVKCRLVEFRAREAVNPTETFEIDLDLALSIVADAAGRPLERLAYAEQHCPVSIPTR